MTENILPENNIPKSNSSTSDFLWSLPQPLMVFSYVGLMISAITLEWIEPSALLGIVAFIPIPLLLTLERLIPNRKDWLLSWKDLAEDTFWVLGTYIIWIPLFDEYYETPISRAFEWLRDMSAFPFTLEAETGLGLFVAAIIGILSVEFIYYWIHRIQHRHMLFWRMHATHHHITKMSAARADRTHPLEFAALNLGSAMALGFLGASGEVVAVILMFRVTSVYLNHCNLPLKSGLYGYIFTTREWHTLHHSCVREESDRNFGCLVIIWDRVFGTFSDKTEVDRVGNGTGEQLSLGMQLTMPFRSDETLRNL